MGYTVAVNIHEMVLSAAHKRGGFIYNFWKNETDVVVRSCQADAPKRTGALAASIRGESLNAGPYKVAFRVRAWSPYALAVHEGTREAEMIKGKTPKGMWVPVAPGSAWRSWRQEVHGQDPQPFLTANMDLWPYGRRARARAAGIRL